MKFKNKVCQAMKPRPQRTNSILQALKSVLKVPRSQKRAVNHRRSGFCTSEFLETRELLSSVSIGPDLSEFQAVPNQTELNPSQGFLTGARTGDPLAIANSFLRNNAGRLGLSSTDIDSLQLTNRYRSAGSGTTHLYFQQTVNGIPVINSHLNVNVARGGQIINVGSSVVPGVSQTTPAPSPQLTATQALDALVAKFGWEYEGTSQILNSKVTSPVRETKLSSAGISKLAEIPASLRYVPGPNGTLELAWLLNVQTTDSRSWYDVAVGAANGNVLSMTDWGNAASYDAIELPGENPLEQPQSTIVDPQFRGTVGSPFGWHDTNGAVGAEFTDTRGNNVFAQEDKDDNDTGGFRPDGGAGLVFNFPFDPTQGAVANENAAIVNLFYVNNVIHDVLYLYGFDEVSGNFQFNNYGNGGLGGDQVMADALDGSGTDNANFFTPPDGISGRMQMYEFTFTTPTRDSDLENFIITHEFGHGLTNRLTGGPANANALQFAQSRGMGEGWSDFLGLMFVQKPTDTQAGAYSTGNYVLGNPLNDPNGGIRDFPYSYNMAISPKTYGYFRANTFPHPNGEIMAATLWDLNWLMINGNGSDVTGKGYSADIYDAASGAGNTELMKIFVEALKLQPVNPTFLDFRDAMLDADLALTGGENEIAIWRAFARRGMGWSAFDGGSASSGNIREAFDLPPGLTIQFTVTPTQIYENAGPGAATATIFRPITSPTNTPLVVALTSSDTTEINVPATVTIPAGQTTLSFPIDVVDDTLLDGTQTVQITGTATIAGKVRFARASMQVLDYETLTVSFSKGSIREDAGSQAAQFTITRSNTDAVLPELVVQLTNGDPTEISIPAQVIIPAGVASVTTFLDAIDDRLLDGTQVVSITPIAAKYFADPIGTILVTDSESLAIDILADEISEDAGDNATTARVYRTDIDGPFDYIAKQHFSHRTQTSIQDLDITRTNVTVPSQVSILNSVTVTIDLEHSFLGDLDIYLISPLGTRVELVTDLVSNQTLMSGTIFDDFARTPILKGSAPFTGRFRPEGRLTDLNGQNPSGIWTLEIADDNIQDFGTLFSWSLNIETAGLSPLEVTLIPTGDIDEIQAPQIVTIPANQSEILVPIAAIDDNILDGPRVSGLTARAVGTPFQDAQDSVTVRDAETLLFTVNGSGVSEAAGPGALTGTLTRLNSDVTQPFTVAVSSSDTSELIVPASVTIPAGQRSVTFPIDAVDDTLFDGTQVVTITVAAPAYGADKTQTILVEDLEPSLLLTSPLTVYRENAGEFTMTMTRQDQSDLSKSVTVQLEVDNLSAAPSPLTVPAFVTIPANQSSQTVRVLINDDMLLDGTQLAVIRASAAGMGSGALTIRVTDHEELIVTMDRTFVREDQGSKAALGTVTRSNLDTALPLVVTLTSSDITELKVPATVTIPAGASSVSFDVEAVNDLAIDGTQLVTVTAAANSYFAGKVRMQVRDHEPPTVTGPGAIVVNPLPTVTWNVVPNALRYDVRLVNRSSGIQQIYPGITATSFVPPEGLGIGRYAAYVRALDQLERPGYWSNAKEFSVRTAPVITAPVSTGSVAAGTFPEIAWTAVIDAAGYQLVVVNQTTGRTVIRETNLTTTSYSSSLNLGSAVYSATVRSFNARNEFGEWSKASSFAVLAPPTVLTPAAGGTFDRTPTVTWKSISGATSYDVQLLNLTTGKEVLRDRSVNGTQFLVPQDLSDGSFKVQVRAQSGRSFSAWSEARIFSVGLPPVITSPGSNAVVGTRPKFVWTAITGAESYELWVQNVTTGVMVLKTANIKATEYTPASALAAGKYRVWVRAVSTMGEVTAFSTAVEFTVALQNSPVPEADAPLLTSALGGRLAVQFVQIDAADAAVTGARPDTARFVSRTVEAMDSDASEQLSGSVEAHDAVMAGWDASEWWIAESSAGNSGVFLHPAERLAKKHAVDTI